ncbi:MAG TPA: hypothetical protein VIC54_07725 [Terriglobales bacterium]|jgi:hypothetical protein
MQDAPRKKKYGGTTASWLLPDRLLRGTKVVQKFLKLGGAGPQPTRDNHRLKLLLGQAQNMIEQKLAFSTPPRHRIAVRAKFLRDLRP